MAIHWQIPFKSLRSGTDYVVNVYDADYSGSPVELTGSDNPFETQEDDDEDMFAPVRTQSGYLRIVADVSETWRDILPTTDIDRPVTLTHGNTIDWVGFLQSQNFGSSLFGYREQIELPVHCPLTAVSRIDATTAIVGSANFALLLRYVIESIPQESRPTTVVAQGGADAQQWLLTRFDWQNLLDVEDTATAKYNYGECLDDMCRFWGWTARIKGKTFYLTCVDDTSMTDALVLTTSDLVSMSAGQTAGTVETMMSNVTVGDIFASVSNYDFQTRGPSKATVKAETGKAESTIMAAFPSSVMEEMYASGFDNTSVVYDYTLDKTSFSTASMSGSCTQNSTFNIMRIKETPANQEQLLPVIRMKAAYNGSTFASIQTERWHNFSDGHLELKGTFYIDGEKFNDASDTPPNWGNKFMYMRLGIGLTRATADWWNGVQWLSSETTMLARVGGNSDTICVSDQKTGGTILWSIPTGFLIDIPGVEDTTVRHGYVFVDFLGSDDIDDGDKVFDIAEFSISFTRDDELFRYIDSERLTSREYTSGTHNNQRIEWNADCIYGTENYSQYGYGVLMNPDFSYMKGYDYDGFGLLTRPEQHLADRVTAYWETSKRKIECELLAAQTDGTATVANTLTPRNSVTIDDSIMYPYSISRIWRDDIVQLKLIELP